MILIDTNVLVAYWNLSDSTHERAVRLLQKIESDVYGPAVITDYVFDEAVTVAWIRGGKKAAVLLGNALLQSFHIIKITEPLFNEAWKIFSSHNISFTDCTNVVAVNEFGINSLATFDAEFKKLKEINVVDS